MIREAATRTMLALAPFGATGIAANTVEANPFTSPDTAALVAPSTAAYGGDLALRAATASEGPQAQSAAYTPKVIARECLQMAILNKAVPNAPQPPPKTIEGARAITINASDEKVTTLDVSEGPDCIGHRTVMAYEVQENDQHQMVRNSRMVPVVVRSNEAVENKRIRIPLRVKYTCEPGSGIRRYDIRFKETATYGGKKQTAITPPYNGVVASSVQAARAFNPC